MERKIDQLVNQIYEEGIEKAKAERESILEAARQEAEAILNQARAAAKTGRPSCPWGCRSRSFARPPSCVRALA